MAEEGKSTSRFPPERGAEYAALRERVAQIAAAASELAEQQRQAIADISEQHRQLRVEANENDRRLAERINERFGELAERIAEGERPKWGVVAAWVSVSVTIIGLIAGGLATYSIRIESNQDRLGDAFAKHSDGHPGRIEQMLAALERLHYETRSDLRDHENIPAHSGALADLKSHASKLRGLRRDVERLKEANDGLSGKSR